MADPAAVVGAIGDQRTEHGIPHRVALSCLGRQRVVVLQHRNRTPTGREVRRQQLVETVKEEFAKSGGTYGSPKIWITLVRHGWRVSVNTIAKLMAELGLVARKVRRRQVLTRPGKRPASPDFVHRDFTAEEPDVVWCGDMTEIVTAEGKLHLAVVIDLFSRRLLGYAMGARHDADLVVAALHMPDCYEREYWATLTEGVRPRRSARSAARTKLLAHVSGRIPCGTYRRNLRSVSAAPSRSSLGAATRVRS